MVSANREMVVYCFDTLVAHYNSEQAPPPAFDEGHYPLFVTWKKAVNGGEPRLRGCIGTLEARYLINGFRDYALTSALRDRRFPLYRLRNYLIWNIGKHGLIIEFVDPDNIRRSATYLPEVAAQEGWTKTETIDSLMRKAGFNGLITEPLRKRVRLTRYQSTLCTMHFSDYASYVKTTRGQSPAIGSKAFH